MNVVLSFLKRVRRVLTRLKWFWQAKIEFRSPLIKYPDGKGGYVAAEKAVRVSGKELPDSKEGPWIAHTHSETWYGRVPRKFLNSKGQFKSVEVECDSQSKACFGQFVLLVFKAEEEVPA